MPLIEKSANKERPRKTTVAILLFDGAEIIGFVVEVKDLLEHPLRLLVDE